ncbi:Paladin [Mactra antiquata]
MGTGASSYTPPPTPLRSLRNVRDSTDPDMIFESTNVTRTDNLVGPVIIKNCMEEYQHVSDFKEPFVYGRLSERLPQHYLIQGSYFLVRDHCLLDGETPKPIQLYQAKNWAPIYWCGQPTAGELASIVKDIEKEGYPEILMFNMREEPVLFVNIAENYIPYTIKTGYDLRTCIVTGKVVKEADLFESDIRREVIALATMNDENKFHFYNDIKTLSGEPHIFPVQFEDNLLVSEEVYSRLAFSNIKLRYRRLCFPLDGAPPDLEVDHFISIAQDSCLTTGDNMPPAMLFTGQESIGRVTLGSVMGYLLASYKDADEKKRRPNTATRRNRMSETELQEQGFFRAITILVSLIENGNTIKHQVDMAIDNCASTYNIRTAIVQAKTKLYEMQADADAGFSFHSEAEIQIQHKKCMNYLNRYFFLICFNAYLRDQYENQFMVGYTKWMNRRPEINHLRSTMFLPVYSTSYCFLETGLHSLVSDNYVGLDLMGSQMDVRVANFRKINIKEIPVYGMAQPSSDGLLKVVNHLLNLKVKHTHVVLINLRNDMMVEMDNATYSLRDAGKLDEPIIFPGFTKSELEDREEELKRIVRKNKIFQVYNELGESPIEREINKAYTILDLAENQRLQTLDMSYYRVPLLCDESPSETDIDGIMEVVCNHCKQERLKNNTSTAFVFFCRTGKSRSTFGMAVAGLILCHMKGFPKGAHKGEQERISCPNAQYTKGEFIIVQKLVRMLPNGHQVKREVDFILDEIFNTMTPMMFHMREMIFVTYNKIKKCETDHAREQILCLSILYLERYVYLILFNSYLHFDAHTNWKRPFSQWMKEVGGRAGVYEVLDNLGFYDFEETLTDFRKMSVRWKYPVPNIRWQGQFI